MNYRLMPTIWKATTKTGTHFHRVKLMSNDNFPRTYCQKAHVETIQRMRTEHMGSRICLKCDWYTDGDTP